MKLLTDYYLFLMPVVGLSVATLAISSQNSGAKFYSRIEPTINLALKYGFLVSTLAVLSFYALGDVFASLLSSNEEVIEQSALYLRVCGFAFYGFVMIFIYISLLQAIQKPAVIFPISVYRQVVAPIFLFSTFKYLGLSIIAIWLGLVLIIFSAAIYLLWYTKRELNHLRKESTSTHSNYPQY